ncbi:MAG: methyl-accepting chemotaxis protein [Nitrospira sp.]|nr:methyl-accepting chemotaxis protein [Nitrospira sp.]
MLNRFKNLNIRLKMLSGITVVGVLMLTIGGMSMVGMNRLNANAEFIYKTNLHGVTIMSDLRAQMLRRSNLVVWHILATDSARMAELEQGIIELDKEIERQLEKYVPLIATEEERKIFESFKAGVPEYMEIRKKMLQLSKNHSKDAAAEMQKADLTEKVKVLNSAVEWLVKENSRQAEESYNTGHDLNVTLNWLMVLTILAAAGIGGFAMWFISKLIVENLSNVLAAAEQLQNGNLTHRSQVRSLDEIGKLAVAFNKMAETMQGKVEQEQRSASEMKGITGALNRAQAVIEFSLDGMVLTANENFLNALGYSLAEIKGQHHRMFCEASYTNSGEYMAFWQRLNRGEYDAGVYRRVGKGGKEVWIQASYNPILDAAGKVYKVVKFATDVTGQKLAQNEVEKLIKTAAAGDLSKRIDITQFEGAAKELTASVNQLLDAVVTPLREAQTVLTALADCDLTRSMTGIYHGEFEQMKSSLNGAVHKLTETITVVREAVEAVNTGSEEISKGSEDLSQRTSEQAGSLEETSASMEQMTSTVKQSADNAKQANQLAIAAREVAEKGGAVTVRAVEAMGEINKSSKKIADIITVIDEIAFQTNLLALNAAVEAARAGEHGRGFAVVASEVRNLAQRSATAAKEIKGLINESIQRVMDGSELVNQSGKTLEEIVNSVKRVTDIIAEISAASQEQAIGIDQVNKAIMQMDETTQQNAALVEQTTSASQTMTQQANSLLTHVSLFKTQVTEAQKAGMKAVGIHRLSTAHAIHDMFAGGSDDDVAARKPQPSRAGVRKQPAAVRPVRSPNTLSAVKTSGTKEEEFEEF